MTPGRAALECELIGSLSILGLRWQQGAEIAVRCQPIRPRGDCRENRWPEAAGELYTSSGSPELELTPGFTSSSSRSMPNTRRNPTQRASTENTTVNSSCQRVSTPSRSGHHSAKTVSSLWTPHCQFQLWPVAKHWYQSSTKPISIIFMDVNKTNNLWLNWMELILLFSINLI